MHNLINKILISILFFIILNNNVIRSQDFTLLPTELESAQTIADLVSLEKGLNPCYTLTCEKYNDTYYYVEAIDLSFILDNTVSLEGINLQVFKNLKVLVMNEYILPQSNILTQLLTLNNLEVLSIYNLIEGTNVEFPQSIKSITFYNFKGVFYGKWIKNTLTALFIKNSFDFEISGTINKNEILTTLSIPVPSSGLPKLDSLFPNLKYLTIYMKNVTYGDDSIIPSSYLGSFSFSSLESLSFLLDSISTTSFTKLFYLPDFSKLNSLSSFEINCDAFSLNSNQVFDLSKIDEDHNLDVAIKNNDNLFKNCNSCLKLRQNTRFVLENVQVNIDSINLSSCSKISLDYIGPNQVLTFKTFNFTQTTALKISNSLVSGDLPDDLCKISFENVDIHDNLFSGRVPSCYLCTSNSEIRDSILPNQFSLNFTTYTPASCPNFKINSYKDNYLIDTVGESIYITGNDIGFLVSFNGDYYSSKFEVVNQVLRIDIDGGIGSEKRTVNATILDDKIIAFKYSYIAPTISSYYIGENSLNLVGSGFDYNGEMNLLAFSSSSVSSNINVTGSTDYAPHISIPLDSLQLKEGQSFNVKLSVMDQQSNTVTFNYGSESISIKDMITLNTTGSTVTVGGKFLTSDINKVSLVIGGLKCTVSKVSSTSLTFTYPKSTKNIGTTPLSLIIDGKFFTTKVNVIFIQDNDNSSNDSDSTSSSDYVSLSFKIKIPNLIYLLYIISLVIIIV